MDTMETILISDNSAETNRTLLGISVCTGLLVGTLTFVTMRVFHTATVRNVNELLASVPIQNS